MTPIWITVSQTEGGKAKHKINAHTIRRIEVVHKPDTSRSTPDWMLDLEDFDGFHQISPARYRTKTAATKAAEALVRSVSLSWVRSRGAGTSPSGTEGAVDALMFAPQYRYDEVRGQAMPDNTQWINRISRVDHLRIGKDMNEDVLSLVYDDGHSVVVANGKSEGQLAKVMDVYSDNFGGGRIDQ